MSEPGRLPWPAGFLARLVEVEKELAVAARALTVPEIAARFEGAPEVELRETLRALVVLQRVSEQGERYCWGCPE